MTIVCFDSSACVKLLIDEPGSELAELLWDEADTVAASRVDAPEVSAALAAARRAARFVEASERSARRAWSTYWAAIDVVEMTVAVAAVAAALASRFLLGGADAVHLASARALERRRSDHGQLGPLALRGRSCGGAVRRDERRHVVGHDPGERHRAQAFGPIDR